MCITCDAWTGKGLRRTYIPLIFLKTERVPYSPARLMCGWVALCHQARNKFYVAISATNVIVPTSTRSFLRANFFLSCDQITYSHSLYECAFSLHLLSFPLRVCFFSSPTLVPFTRVFFSSRYERRRCYCNMFLTPYRQNALSFCLIRCALCMKINTLEDVN